jgi:predicted chitinase
VRRGDTLSEIAAANGTDWQTLARINGIQDPSLLQIGQRIRLPEAAPAAPVATPETAAVIEATPAAAGAVTADQIRAIMPDAGARADDYADALNEAMDTHGIATPEQRAAFLAQISVESGQLRDTEENLNYSAQRLTEVWPGRFPTVEAAAPFARNPEALANHVYSSRLGNGDPAGGDGYLYRGRGLMQVTGRANYRAIGFEHNPEALSEPATAADTAARWWADNNLNVRTEAALNRTDFDAISRTVNGGNHGIDERWEAYQRGLEELRP